MFSMIITIMAIFLVAALALATIFYGSQYYKDGQARAAAAKAIQQGNQITGAVELFKTDKGALPTGTNDEIKAKLVADNYLTSWPSAGWELRNDYAVRTDLDETTCLSVNKSLGIDTIPSCTDVNYEKKSFCCTTQ